MFGLSSNKYNKKSKSLCIFYMSNFELNTYVK